MAYEVTATRRRPKTFDELAGQEFVVATLKSSIETGRIAHAYLFSGPRGCGKTSAARILARSLNCENPGPDGPCGTCSACVEIARGANMDVIEIDGASNTSVNDVRQIKDEVLFPPNAGKYKIYIIDEVHMLSNSAFNALLKTIEEPPPYIIFIFATTELHKVPATIKSRCQQFAFRLISIETIRDILASACNEMGITAEDEALLWIARESTGSLRDAYTLFDQVVAFSNGKLTAALIREKLGVVGHEAIDALVEACTKGEHAQVFSTLDDILQRGVSVEQLVVDLAEYYRSLLLIKSGIDKESLVGHGLERFSAVNREQLSLPQIHHALELLLGLYRDIRFSVSPRFELETLISALCWLPSWVSPIELAEAVQSVRAVLGGLPHQNAPMPGGGGGARPFGAEPAVREGRAGQDIKADDYSHTAAATPESFPADTTAGGISFDGSSSISETFKRLIAQKNGKGPVEGSSSGPARAASTASAEAGPNTSSPGLSPRETGDENAPARDPEPPHFAPPMPEPMPENKPWTEQAQSEAYDEPEGTADLPDQAAAPSSGGSGTDDSFLADLKASLQKTLSRGRGMLASAITKSDSWTLDNGVLHMRIRDKLTAELLERESAWLAGEIGRMLGSPISLGITLSLPEVIKAVVSEEQSKAVENVCRIFKGTIIRT